MEPTREDDAIVDLLDVLLRDGAMIQADVIVTVADIPLIGINLRAAIAGMATMREYGFFEDWDAAIRATGSPDQRAASRRGKFVPRAESGHHGEKEPLLPSKRPGDPILSSADRTPPSKRPDQSGRPFQDDDESVRSRRPHEEGRLGAPEQSPLSERPHEGGRPKGLNLREKSSGEYEEDRPERPTPEGDDEGQNALDPTASEGGNDRDVSDGDPATEDETDGEGGVDQSDSAVDDDS